MGQNEELAWLCGDRSPGKSLIDIDLPAPELEFLDPLGHVHPSIAAFPLIEAEQLFVGDQIQDAIDPALFTAIPALRRPLKFVPVLLLQLIYKPIWLAVVAVPVFLKGQFPLYVVVFGVIFLTYIIGDLIAIPFYLFSSE